MRYKLLLGTLLLLPIISGCSKNSTPSLGEAESNLIFGLWTLYSEPDGENTSYFSIKKDRIVYYFYQGNSTLSQNCFLTEEQTIVHVQGSYYADENGNETSITADESTLTLEFVDTEDEDDDGDTSETIVESFSRASGISEVDLLVCE